MNAKNLQTVHAAASYPRARRWSLAVSDPLPSEGQPTQTEDDDEEEDAAAAGGGS